jgi:hypothetical protein
MVGDKEGRSPYEGQAHSKPCLGRRVGGVEARDSHPINSQTFLAAKRLSFDFEIPIERSNIPIQSATMWGYPKLGMLPVPRRRPTSASAPAAGPSGSNSMALQGSDKPQARTRNQHSAVRRPVTAVIHGLKALIYHHVAALDPVTAYPPPLEPIVHQGFVHSSSAASVTIQEGRPTIERMSVSKLFCNEHNFLLQIAADSALVTAEPI